MACQTLGVRKLLGIVFGFATLYFAFGTVAGVINTFSVSARFHMDETYRITGFFDAGMWAIGAAGCYVAAVQCFRRRRFVWHEDPEPDERALDARVTH